MWQHKIGTQYGIRSGLEWGWGDEKTISWKKKWENKLTSWNLKEEMEQPYEELKENYSIRNKKKKKKKEC